MAAPSSNNYVSAKRLSEVVYGKDGTGGQHVDGLWDKIKQKSDKVSGVTGGNFAGLDSSGNLTDSGKKAADFKTVQTAKSSPTVSGNALSFIDTVSQDTNGVITATKKSVTVDTTYSASGTNPVSGKAVDAALKTLDSNATSTDGTNVQVKVTEADGKITAVNITTDNTENKNNKKQSINDSSTTDFPSSKAVADFVNSSVATNTAKYISNDGEPFTSVAQLEAYSGTVTNNDYAFVTGTDTAGNTYYDRYKATVSGSTVTWAKEYRLNNSSFTATQWAAINSNITSTLVTSYNSHLTNTSNPHSVTKSQVGLGSVVNTGDSATPVSGGTTKFTTGGAYTELAKKADKSSTVTNVAYDTTSKKITKTINGTTTDVVSASTLKTDMSLNNVGNFKAVSTVASQGLSSTEQSNARANIGAGTGTYSKPSGGIPSSDMSSAVQASLTKADNAIPSSQKGAANGVGTLDANGKVPTSQLPNFGYGTVTSVATGVGLKGGTITGSGTISANVPRNPSSDVNSPFPTSTTANTIEMQEYNGSTQSHCPSSDWWHILSSIGSDANYMVQLAQKLSDRNTPDLCVRVLAAGGWSDWFSTRDASWIQTGTISSDRLPVGVANGVGTLDANGVQPYSEMYKGYVVSGSDPSTIFKLCRIPKDANYGAGVSFVFTSRVYNKASGQVLLWISPCEWEINTVNYKVVNLFARAADVTMQFYYKEVTVNSNPYIDVYYRVYGSSNTHVMPLWMRPGVQDMLTTKAVTLPDGAVEMSTRYFNVCAAKGGVGSTNTPVYVNSSGDVTPCGDSLTNKRNFPKLNFFFNGSNSSSARYIKVATITCGVPYFDHPFVFRCIGRYQLIYTINLMFQGGNTTKPGILRFNVEVPTGFSVSTADVQITYDDSGTSRVYTLWVNPGVHTDVQTVLECENNFAQFVELINGQYSTSLSGALAPQYIKYAQSITPGNRTGNESTPIFMENDGTLKPCTSLTPIPTSYSAASATKGYKIATVENSGGGDPMYAGCMIAVCLRDNGGADCQIILSVSFSEYGSGADTEPISGKAFILHNRITTIGAIRFFVNKVSASKCDIYAYTNGSNNYLSCQCISGKGVTINSSPSSETITISNMTELARSRAVVTQKSGQIGSSTRPVYVNGSGVVQPCDEAGYIRLADGPQQSYTPGVCYLI